MNKNLLSEEQKNIISERIRLLRTEDGLSQEELADMLGVKQQTVAAWESSERTIKLNVLYDLAGIFNVSTDFILGISDAKSAEGQISGEVYGLNYRTESRLKSFAKTGGRKVPVKYIRKNATGSTRLLVQKLLERDDIDREGNEALRAELSAFLESEREEDYEAETMSDVLNDVIEAILDSELLVQLFMCRHCVRELQASMKKHTSIAEELVQRRLALQFHNHLDRCRGALEYIIDNCSHIRDYKKVTRSLVKAYEG